MNDDSLNVLVTGATGGIGREICRVLLGAGCQVLGSASNEHSLERLRQVLAGASDGHFDTFVADFRSITSVEILAKHCDEVFHGRLDVLVNSAGVGYHCRVDCIVPQELVETFHINAIAPILLISRLAPLLRNSKCGRVINISSILGTLGLPLTSTYTASKHALEGFSRVLRLELGLSVTSVQPGAVGTSFLEQTHDPPAAKAFSERDLKRLDPKEVARWVKEVVFTECAVVPEVIRLVPAEQVV